jgi:hypothetical protein
VHSGTAKSAVLTLSGPGELEHVARLVAECLPPEAFWLADHAVNNTLDPARELLSAEGIAARRARLREQRFHAGRAAVCALVYAQALETRDAEAAAGSRGSVRGFASIAAFLSDEWAMEFQSDERHERMKENFRALGESAKELGERVMPWPGLDEATDRLFDEYFWAA